MINPTCYNGAGKSAREKHLRGYVDDKKGTESARIATLR